jgi:hypothetical protein
VEVSTTDVSNVRRQRRRVKGKEGRAEGCLPSCMGRVGGLCLACFRSGSCSESSDLRFEPFDVVGKESIANRLVLYVDQKAEKHDIFSNAISHMPQILPLPLGSEPAVLFKLRLQLRLTQTNSATVFIERLGGLGPFLACQRKGWCDLVKIHVARPHSSSQNLFLPSRYIILFQINCIF